MPKTMVVALSMTLAAVGAVAGCTSKSDGHGTPTPSGSPSVRHVDLRVAVYGDDATVSTYQQVADAFSEEHPEVTVTVTSTPNAAAAARTAVDAVESGSKTAPDVFLVDHDDFASVVDAGVTQPVDQLLEDRAIPFGEGIVRVALKSFAAHDGLACMPQEVSPQVVYFNRRLVKPHRLVTPQGERVGPIAEGWSFEAFRAAAQQAVANGARGVYLPPDLEEISPFLLSAGGTLVDDDRAPTTLTLASSVDALRQLGILARDPELSLSPAEAAAKSPVQRFADGELGMLVGTRSLVPTLRQADGLRFDVAPMPKLGHSVTVSDMSAYCLSAHSAHVPEAADFIAFAVDGKGAEIAARSGLLVPVSIDALHSDAFTQPGQEPRNVSAFVDGAVRRSQEQPFSEHWREAVALADRTLARVFSSRAVDLADDSDDLADLLAQLDDDSVAVFAPTEATPSP